MATNLNVPIPQNPIGESFVWRDWFQRLSNRVFGSMSGQDNHAVFVTGGVIDGTIIGGTTPAAGTFTNTTTGSLTVPTGSNGQILVGRTSDHHFVPATLGTSTGLSTISGAGTLTLNNTGVTSIIAGSNITVSGATGAVTINSTTVTTGATGTFKSGDLPTAKTITVTNGLITSIV